MQDGGRSLAEGGTCRRSPKAGSPQLGDERVLRVVATRRGSAVQDGWLAALHGEAQVASEVGELRFRRGMHPIVVEAGLTDGDNPRIGGESDDRGPVGLACRLGLVRVNAGRGVDPAVFG